MIWKEYLLWHPCHPRRKVPQQWPCVDVFSGSGGEAVSLATNDTSWPPSPGADTPRCPLATDSPPYRLKTASRKDNNCMTQKLQIKHIIKSIINNKIFMFSGGDQYLAIHNMLFQFCNVQTEGYDNKCFYTLWAKMSQNKLYIIKNNGLSAVLNQKGGLIHLLKTITKKRRSTN